MFQVTKKVLLLLSYKNEATVGLRLCLVYVCVCVRVCEEKCCLLLAQ